MGDSTKYVPYSSDPLEGPSVVFPSHSHQVLSSFIQIIGASILAFCFARRTDKEQIGSRQDWIHLPWAKICVILLFLDSWIFLVLSGILISGVGLSYSVATCSLGIYVCIIFYAASKALIYLFLVERVWIVWSAGKSLSRRNSTVYKLLMTVIMGYSVIFILLVIGHIAHIRMDGACVIGLRSFASLPLLSYDLFVNILLTSMFIWPLQRSRHTTNRLRSLAWRTLAAAAVALTTSSVNIAILTILDGKQLGWVCLGSCATDVTINALVIFWVTAGSSKTSSHARADHAVASARKNENTVPAALSLSMPQSASQVLSAMGSPQLSHNNFNSEVNASCHEQQPRRLRMLNWLNYDRRTRIPPPSNNNAVAIFVNMDTYTITDDLPAATSGDDASDEYEEEQKQSKVHDLEEGISVTESHADDNQIRSSGLERPDGFSQKASEVKPS